MNVHEFTAGKKKVHFGATVFLSAFLSACGPQMQESSPSTDRSTSTSRTEVPGSIDELQRRYETAAQTEELFIRCMEGYFPNYRREVEEYGSIFMGDPLDDTPHPSEEGCRTERDARNRSARDIGLPPI